MNIKIQAIIFCGLDGSGKTTQAKKLSEFLKSKKIRYSYAWLRYPNRISLPFAGLLRLFKLTGYPLTEKRKNLGFKNLSQHPTLSKIWIQLLFYDFKLMCKIRVFDQIKGGKLLILDRYVIDTIIELAINNEETITIENLVEKFSDFIPKNSMIIFLDLKPKISYERNHEESLDILNKKRELYHKVCKYFEIQIIDADQEISKIHNEILQKCNLK